MRDSGVEKHVHRIRQCGRGEDAHGNQRFQFHHPFTLSWQQRFAIASEDPESLPFAILRGGEREKGNFFASLCCGREVRKILFKGGITLALDATQKEKLAALLAQEHVAVLVTQAEPWPTANLQAFAETPELDLLFIMGANVDKYQNLLKQSEATVLVDNRDVGNVPTFEIVRAWMQGRASDVARGSAEWESHKAIFLKKNPFEEPFFKN